MFYCHWEGCSEVQWSGAQLQKILKTFARRKLVQKGILGATFRAKYEHLETSGQFRTAAATWTSVLV